MSLDSAAMRVVVEQMQNPATGDQELVVDGQVWRIRHRPRPGVKVAVSLDAEGGSPIIAVYEPSATRPSGYSAAVPFVPHLEAAVTTIPGSEAMTVMWGDLPDAAAVAHQLEMSSIAEGWSASGESASALRAMGMIELQRAGQNRLLTTIPGPRPGVMLTQGSIRDRTRKVT
jgi:hypothetical protein